MTVEAELPQAAARAIPKGGRRCLAVSCRRRASSCTADVARADRDRDRCSALLAACAKKPATLPAPRGRARGSPTSCFPPAAGDWRPRLSRTQHRPPGRCCRPGTRGRPSADFTAILKQAPDFYPAEAGLGYAALARKDAQAARWRTSTRRWRERRLTRRRSPGRGEALLSLGRTDAAAEAFQAALAADPGLTALRSRVDVLKFRGVQQNIESARKAAEAGRLEEARRGYLAAIAASPESAFLYRELAAMEQQGRRPRVGPGRTRSRRSTLDPADARALMLIAEVLEGNGEWAKAADAYAAANAVEPSRRPPRGSMRCARRRRSKRCRSEYRVHRDVAHRHARAARRAARRRGSAICCAAPRPTPVVDDRRAGQLGRALDPVRHARRASWSPSPITRSSRTRPSAAAISPRPSAACSALVGDGRTRGWPSRWRDPRPKFSDVGPGHLLLPGRRARRIGRRHGPARRGSLPAARAGHRMPKRATRVEAAKSSPKRSSLGPTFTPANQLTMMRMLLIPAFVILLMYGYRGWALVTFLPPGLTDLFDGLIARMTGDKTTLGAWLDPMADKLLL